MAAPCAAYGAEAVIAPALARGAPFPGRVHHPGPENAVTAILARLSFADRRRSAALRHASGDARPIPPRRVAVKGILGYGTSSSWQARLRLL